MNGCHACLYGRNPPPQDKGSGVVGTYLMAIVEVQTHGLANVLASLCKQHREILEESRTVYANAVGWSS